MENLREQLLPVVDPLEGEYDDPGTAFVSESSTRPSTVAFPSNHHPITTVTVTKPSIVTVGEKQPDGFRDIFFAIVFLGQLVAILFLALFWGFPSLNFTIYDTNMVLHVSGIVWVFIVTSFVAFVVSVVTLQGMTRFAPQLIPITLSGGILLSLILAALFLWNGILTGCLVCGLYATMSILYTRSIWDRIPFAACHLQTALTALQAQTGIILLSYMALALWQIWTFLWIMAWFGVYARHDHCRNNTNRSSSNNYYDYDYYSDTNITGTDCISHTNGFVVFLLLVSYMWTTAVGKNILAVTVANVVGVYCLSPEGCMTRQTPYGASPPTWTSSSSILASCCGNTIITDALLRSCTYRLGSICLGSLLTALLQVIHHILQAMRQSTSRTLANSTSTRYHCGILTSVLECLTSFLERIVQYFHQWSYCYIGLYGYDYLTAGRKVLQLFHDRGWTILLNDSILHRTLVLASGLVGLVTGAIGTTICYLIPSLWMVIQQSTMGTPPSNMDGNTTSISWFVSYSLLLGPTAMGTALAWILFLSILGAALDTVLIVVCEQPQEFEQNHPGLFRTMMTAWGRIYPNQITANY